MTRYSDKPTGKKTVFCHQQEMLNFTSYLYHRHHRDRHAELIDFPGDAVPSISPKVLTLLLLAEENILLTPVASHPEVGIVLEICTAFGQACIYSKIKGGWATEETGSSYLGFSTSFNDVSPEMLSHLKSSCPGFEVILEPESNVANLASSFKINPDQCTLSDVHAVLLGWLGLFEKAHEVVTTLGDKSLASFIPH